MIRGTLSAKSSLGRSIIVLVAILRACKRAMEGEKKRRIEFVFRSCNKASEVSSAASVL